MIDNIDNTACDIQIQLSLSNSSPQGEKEEVSTTKWNVVITK